MVCRLLRSLEGGQSPDEGGPLAVDGIVYLSDACSFHRVTVPDLYAGLTKLVPEEIVSRLESVYKNPQLGTRETMQALLDAFPQGRTVVLLDNFEDAVDVETGRDTSLREILDSTKQFLPEKVVAVLVGEAFSRLDLTAQRVMQALATYRYPVPAAAVDYLLQPYVPGLNSAPVLSRLVNMQFVRRDAGRYYLHQIDRDYALGRIAEGEPADRGRRCRASPALPCNTGQRNGSNCLANLEKPGEHWRTSQRSSRSLSCVAQAKTMMLRRRCYRISVSSTCCCGGTTGC
jgi:hypothetical protein